MIPLLGTMIVASSWALVSQQRISSVIAILFAAAAMILHVVRLAKAASASSSDDFVIPEPIKAPEVESPEIETAEANSETDLKRKSEAEGLLNSFRAIAPRLADLSRYVMSRSEEAATQSTESAFSIAEEARKASSRVAALLNNVNCGDDCLENRVALLRSELSQFNVLVEELNQVSHGYGRDLARMDELARQVENHTTSIQDIAERTGILSINASIEAARAGSAGKGFTVIAQEVRKLSDTTSEITDQIGSVIKDFGRAVSRSSADSSVRLKKVLGEIEEIRTALDTSVDVLVPQVESVAMSVTEAESLTGSVSGKLEDVTVWFQTQDALRQAIEHISGAIIDMGRRYDDFVGTQIPTEIQKQMDDDLTRRFTVEDEWQALGMDPPASGDDVTLF
ncbi:MAG: methyl-accepting chemotaxis protein [Spirochaetaceae bacterium]|nr:methyl-accepting chemotaxis protein [Spirochaetaceae bacterium]MDT8297657.1 methyl-accepting chemotaxis protein [Spirochaetaceae bacterium]